MERHVLLATPLGNVGSVGYLFVSSVKGVGVAFVVSPRLLYQFLILQIFLNTKIWLNWLPSLNSFQCPFANIL